MQVLITIALVIIGVLLFELIIFCHEFGHFITAKRSGVQVNEFALGMGPKLFSFKRGETTYSLRAFPIGGFCAMEGEDEQSDNPRAFTNAKIWKRMIIIVAGAFMNFVLGFILMFVVVVQAPGYESNTISGFVPYSNTAATGLKAGDQVVSIDGLPIWNARDLMFGIQTTREKEVDADSLTVYIEDCTMQATLAYSDFINLERSESEALSDELQNELIAALGKGCEKIRAASTKDEAYRLMQKTVDAIYTVSGEAKPKDFKYPVIEKRDRRLRHVADVKVIRDGEELTLKDVHFYSYYKDEEAQKKSKSSVGIDFYVEPIEKNFFTVIQQTGSQTITLAKSVWQSLIMLVQGRFSFNDLSGPVGITKAVSVVASEGLKTGFGDAVNNIIFIMALITVNLGIVNMLPFPALDGGRFVFLCVEAIIRKPLPRKFEYIVNAVGLAILIGFIIVISVKDVWQLITGNFPSL